MNERAHQAATSEKRATPRCTITVWRGWRYDSPKMTLTAPAWTCES